MWLFSQTPAENAKADPTINYREGQSPGSLNDAARSMMAALAKYRDDISGSLVTTGTLSAYSVSTNENFNPTGSNVLIDGLTIAIRPNVTNGQNPTIDVDGSGPKPMRGMTGAPLGAGFLIAGSPYRITYFLSADEWLVHAFMGNPYGIPIGMCAPFVSETPPNSNFVLPYGQAISRTTYAALFTLCGTSFGTGDGSTTFNIPDLRGRIPVGKDDMGGSAANRITSAGSSVDGTAIGAHGGGENVTLAQSALPNVSPTFNGTAVPDHTHDEGISDAGSRSGGGSGSHLANITGTNAEPHATGLGGGHTPAGTISSINGGVTQTAVNKLPPVIVLPMLMRVI